MRRGDGNGRRAPDGARGVTWRGETWRAGARRAPTAHGGARVVRRATIGALAAGLALAAAPTASRAWLAAQTTRPAPPSPAPSAAALPPASAPPRPVLTLGEALALAAARQPLLAVARGGADAAAALATAARARRLPQLDLQADLTGTTAPTRFGATRAGGAGDTTGTPIGATTRGGTQLRTNFSTVATLSQPLFAPRLAAEADAARAAARAASFDRDQASLDVAFAVVRDYFAQVRAEQLVRVQEEQLRQLARAARDLALREREGSGRRVDALRAEAQRALAAVAVREARAQAAQAAAQLVASLGAPPEAARAAVDTAGAAWPADAWALDTALVAPGPPPTALEPIVRAAEASSPRLRAFRAAAEERRATARAARADLLPTIGGRIGAGYQQSDVNPRAAFGTYGLSLGWPVFSSGAVQAVARAAEAEARVAEAQAELERVELRRRAAAALGRWTEADRRLAASESALRAAREALGIVTGAYREGAFLLVEVFQAQADVVRAEQGRVQALVDARVARAELALVLGQQPEVR